ncbi:uncharacterized protein Z518_08015 [Rhinocladiella mackenziei CBS 650.93]|uniref:Spindle pole body component n=1 Tax=Rhinocladiella mackenziei CBS 650.93 TaxID=1442369 RepID=A0A0D2IFP1_9EURO|nr:uncharacterized protein Z518_08015 [Rhinocladiella mackenziei CBS 650.93]KIX02076.1 hypothetical protein Z518_08015 [Rhinocladiella mackenziei CBS 650.93]
MSTRDAIDPFSTAAVREIPTNFLESSPIWDGFVFDNGLDSEFLRLNDHHAKPLPDIEPDIFRLNLQDVSRPDISPPASACASDSGNDQLDIQNQQDVHSEAADVWVLPEVVERRSQNEPVTWDIFLTESHQEPMVVYLSEASPKTFNAILRRAYRDIPPRTVKPNVLLNAAFELGLGRGSALFVWDENEARFIQQFEKISAAGYSPKILQSFFEPSLSVATKTKLLNAYFQDLTNAAADPSPCRIAFLSASRSVLYGAHKYLEILRPEMSSLLQLKGIMTKFETLLTVLKNCADLIRSCQTEDTIVSALMQLAANASINHPGIDGVLQEIFSRTCQPILAKLSDDVGLTSARAINNSETSLEEDVNVNPLWTTLFQGNCAQMIRETRQSLEILRSYAPDCPVLSSAEYGSSFLLNFELGFSFDFMCELQSRSVAYEDAMKSLIVSAGSSTSSSSISALASENFDLEEAGILQSKSLDPFQLGLDLFGPNVPLFDHGDSEGLHDQVMIYLESREFDISPFQLDFEQALNFSVIPLISAQHRLLSYSVLQLLFQEHNLIMHLNLQRSFHLFGHAFFASRLSTALFDPDQTSGEKQRRTGGSTGLRLQVRDTWPPASSELRLVLMSVLSDSLAASKDRSLEDTISFAIRDMSLDELEKCRDVDSIHALDFLRLQYKPPNEALESVLTAEILDKYDRIFLHLLRILRLQSMVQSLVRDNIELSGDLADHKFILEMRHFITTLADYCNNTAIGFCWRKFETVLHDVETYINNKDYERTLQTVQSQDYLRVLHKIAVDNILHALLLKKKQSNALQILNQLFSLILQFAAEKRSGRMNSFDYETPAERFQRDFRHKIIRFLDALHVQGEGRFPQLLTRKINVDDADDGDDEEVNLFEYLLLRLDMFDYWRGSRKGRRRGISHMDL